MTLTASASVFLSAAPVLVVPERPVLYRILHDVELGSVRNVTLSNGAPEIFRMEPFHFSKFTEDWQRLSFEMNPGMTPEKWTSLYSWKTVITNGQGYGKPGDDRANFIEGTNERAELPRVASLLFGGNVINGWEEGEWLWVNTLNANQPAPELEFFMARRWLYSIGTNVRKDGRVGRLPQGGRLDVLIPIYASKPVRFPLSKLRRLRDDEPIPEPYT